MADNDTPDPSTKSGDYEAMSGYWNMVCAILGGAEAMRAPSHQGGAAYGPPTPAGSLALLERRFGQGPQSPYLPQFPNETPADYDYRRRTAPFTNIYGDISADLAAKPFGKKCELDDSAPANLKELSQNIDGQGNNLHVFASETFKAGLDFAVDWILVDYTRVPPGATLAAEKAMGARPYWVHIPAQRMLAVYSAFLNGQEIITHARIYEPVTVQSGYGEACIERVRVLNRAPVYGDPEVPTKITGYDPATFEIYEKQESDGPDGKKQVVWVVIDGGAITIGIIPLVPFRTGKRHGSSWKIDPPLRDIAHLQVEEFQQESNLKYTKELTAFPMLAGNGIPGTDRDGNDVKVPVGPKAVLFAQPDGLGNHGEWKFIEPSGASLTFLKDDLEALRDEMRDLGKQPLASANLTVVTTANIAMRANSAVQAWALLFKDALEQAWMITGLWLNQKVSVTVNVNTDFGVDLQANTELAELNKATWLSDENKFAEFKRRGVIRSDATWDENETQIAGQVDNQSLAGEQPIDPVTGQPIAPAQQQQAA